MDNLPIGDKTFEDGSFKVDFEKNLYKKDGDGYTLVQKLKKSIYSLAAYEDETYFIDTFGDCYLVGGSSTHFIFGILSNPLYFAVKNNRIYALDKYSRMWVHDLDGEILNISFLKENIHTVTIEESYCSVSTDGNRRVVDYNNAGKEEGPVAKEKKIMVCDRSFTVLKEIEIDRVTEFGSDFIVYEIDGNPIKLCIQDLRENLKE